MCPRNPCAIIATTLCLLLGLAGSADAGPSVSITCAKPSGNCSGKKLFGRHLWKQNLTRTRWVGSRLLLASFRYSDLYNSSFRNAKMRRVDLSYGNRTQSDFRNAEMTLANLSHADFWGSNFRKADLRGAKLVDTHLGHTNLFGANFEGAVFINVDFSGIRLCHTTQPDGTVRNDDCPNNNGNGKGPGGGLCCFPGGKKPAAGKGTDTTATDDGTTIVGDL